MWVSEHRGRKDGPAGRGIASKIGSGITADNPCITPSESDGLTCGLTAAAATIAEGAYIADSNTDVDVLSIASPSHLQHLSYLRSIQLVALGGARATAR